MAATINTNIASINAQRNLSLSGQSLNTTMQRLSSGLRVNSAKDDAAGLAIAERMNTQVKGLTVAARNANDGISLAQTAEGALGKVGDMLQRMRELAVQASNATNSASDRKALQAEVKQLASEIDRVAKQTNFNGQKILDGSFAGAVFQVGANSGDNVTLGALADTRASMVSNINYAKNQLTFDTKDTPVPAIADFDQAIPAGDLKITVEGLPTIELEGIDPANSSLERIGQVITAINNKTPDTGVTAYMTLKEGTQEYSISLMSSKVDSTNTPLDITFDGFTASTTGLMAPSAYNQSNQVFTQFDAATAATIPAAATLAADEAAAINTAVAQLNSDPILGKFSAQWATAATNAQVVGTATTATVGTLNAAVDTVIGNYDAAVAAKKAHLADPTDLVKANAYTEALTVLNTGVNTGYTAATDITAALQAISPLEVSAGLDNNGLNINQTHQNLNERGVNTIDVTTQEGAWVALKKIDSAVDQINSARATLGAMQARFENAVNNIDIQVENLSAARGRIMDADFAVESANLSRTQILQQAGTAMVAQANQIPQNVLQLLQG